MYLRRVISIISIMVLVNSCLLGQAAGDSVSQGKVSGIAYDSTLRYVLKAATVSMYVGDSSRSPVSFLLTGNMGEFSFEKLPLNVQLKLVISYIGYQSISKNIFITSVHQELSLGRIALKQADNTLDEVTVTYVPPVRMNNDTLEFNPKAFQLGENAVAEDLLKKLPGVVMWGDGSITVNGRQVTTVLVNNKPFFGGTAKVATQNIPKKAIDKIQVFQQTTDPLNPMDSSTIINIKLLKNYSRGSFGKFSAGVGSDGKNDLSGNMNTFWQKNQLSAVVAGNNVNKGAVDVKTFLANNTYRNEASSFDYESQFSLPGINRTFQTGLLYQHDFIDKPDLLNRHSLSADAFTKKADQRLQSQTYSLMTINKDSSLLTSSLLDNTSHYNSRNAGARYEYRKNSMHSMMNFSYDGNNGQTQSISNSTVSDNFGTLRSRALQQSSGTSQSDKFVLNGSLTQGSAMIGNSKIFHLLYSFNSNFTSDSTQMKNDFDSYAGMVSSYRFSRHYLTNRKSIAGMLNFSANNLLNVHSINTEFFRVGAGVELGYDHAKANSRVSTENPLTNLYVTDSALTARNNYNAWNFSPYLLLRRNFSRTLSGRYSKTLDLNFTLKYRTNIQENTSDHSFQNFYITDRIWIADFSARYSHIKNTRFQNIFTFTSTLMPIYPGSEKLVPLVDSINPYNIVFGNPKLLPGRQREFVISMSHKVLNKVNPFSYDLSVRSGWIHSYLTDSIRVSANGSIRHYAINADGYSYLNFNGKVFKFLKLNNRPLQVVLSETLNTANRPSYINGIPVNGSLIQNRTDADIFYYPTSFLIINSGASFSSYQLKQSIEGQNPLRNQLFSARLNINAGFSSRFNIGSNITLNNSVSADRSLHKSFAIWNATAAYRFLAKEDAEIKLHVFDILHQNSNVLNYGYDNVIVSGNNNVLQQFFMVTLSFFPRFFGSKTSN